MRIEEIDLADSKVIMKKKDIKNKELVFFFSYVFNIPNKEIVDNVEIVFFDWTSFNQSKFVSYDNFESYKEVKINIDEEFETFSLIQEIIFEKEKITLKGYSKESSSWLVYEFNNVKTKVVVI